jgi:hypothetical protein
MATIELAFTRSPVLTRIERIVPASVDFASISFRAESSPVTRIFTDLFCAGASATAHLLRAETSSAGHQRAKNIAPPKKVKTVASTQ